MLKLALSFVINNVKKATRINNEGVREDILEYPIKAIREVILNALIHRDYSIHTENEPIRLIIYDDRLEVSNPGGLYGRLSIDDLGKVHSDIRNPFIIYDRDNAHTLREGAFGLANVAPTVVKMMGLTAPECWEDSMV